MMSILRYLILMDSTIPSLSSTASRLVLLALFPVVVGAIQLAFILKLDATQPSDDLNCDASHPTWYARRLSANYVCLPIPPGFALLVTLERRCCLQYRHSFYLS